MANYFLETLAETPRWRSSHRCLLLRTLSVRFAIEETNLKEPRTVRCLSTALSVCLATSEARARSETTAGTIPPGRVRLLDRG
ncbi:hypothetical protein ARMSODRAFT_292515 [Armillaria solidipes]|uniref:Uncharacterized protein n=1 Tax=Armillaria solidipes TaxID=1076256 RepID=A0A2H3BYB1_9AGAR|nr:hypothetical protein ARMSODRAFT_292515 [Armillaria solidipes]